MKFGEGADIGPKTTWVWNAYYHFVSYQLDHVQQTNSKNFQYLYPLSDLGEFWYVG